MFQLLIVISRYLFLLYMAFFLYEGLQFVLRERRGEDVSTLSRRQQICILLFVITAYAILIYALALSPYVARNGIVFTTVDGIKNGVAVVVFLLFAFVSSRFFYKKGCPLLWNGVFFLLAIGLVMLQRLNPILAQRQIIWCFCGYSSILLILLVFRLIKNLDRLQYVYLVAGFLLLISTFVLGHKQGGAFNWIVIHGISVQPSELVKFLYVFYLASILKAPRTNKQLIMPIITSCVFVVCLVAQTDLGGALIFFMTFMVILYISTSKEYLFFLGMLAMSFGSCVAYRLFHHVRTRVAVWQNPWYDPTGGGYQVIQSLYAICTWGFFGAGLTRGLPEKIPVVERDFIFSAICEEFGVLFAIGILLVFIMIFYKGARIALQCQSRFYSLVVAGFTSMLAFQVFLIVGGTIKLIPLTGVTLSFISYGGSSIMMSMLMIGVLQWIHNDNEIRNGATTAHVLNDRVDDVG